MALCPSVSLCGGTSLGSNRFESVHLVSIEDGIVVVSAANPGSARRIIASLAGSGSIVLPPAAHERFEALADARLTLIPGDAYKRLLDIAAAATIILESLGTGLRECRESIAQLGSRSHSDRVLEKLVQLARTHGKVGNEGLILDLPLTHELLAAMVGSTRETVTRSLARLAREGLVRHEHGRYLVAKPAQAIGR